MNKNKIWLQFIVKLVCAILLTLFKQLKQFIVNHWGKWKNIIDKHWFTFFCRSIISLLLETKRCCSITVIISDIFDPVKMIAFVLTIGNRFFFCLFEQVIQLKVYFDDSEMWNLGNLRRETNYFGKANWKMKKMREKNFCNLWCWSKYLFLW